MATLPFLTSALFGCRGRGPCLSLTCSFPSAYKAEIEAKVAVSTPTKKWLDFCEPKGPGARHLNKAKGPMWAWWPESPYKGQLCQSHYPFLDGSQEGLLRDGCLIEKGTFGPLPRPPGDSHQLGTVDHICRTGGLPTQNGTWPRSYLLNALTRTGLYLSPCSNAWTNPQSKVNTEHKLQDSFF